MPENTSCFHCGLPVGQGPELVVPIMGEPRAMCCHGCEAVAQAIVDAGMESYYRHRTEPAATGQQVVPAFLEQLEVWDNPKVQGRFVERDAAEEDAVPEDGDGHAEVDGRQVSLILEGISCAACVWLNERYIGALPGVISVSINYSTWRARVHWDNKRIRLSEILEAISRIGYLAHPYDPARQQQVLERSRKDLIRRLGVGALLGMQVMLFSVALYTGDWWGMEPGFEQLFRGLSFVLCLPILLYSARPFFVSAWRDLRRGTAGMDVPVSLGMGIAFTASAWHVWTGQGEVYFDSVAMFAFFLLVARYFELVARKRSMEAIESLVQMQPAVATRLRHTELDSGVAEGLEESVPVADLRVGDMVLVRPGESIPADGEVIDGHSSVDESLLTGESMPVARRAGNTVLGGSLNVESPLQIRVTHCGEETVLSSILQLLERAQADKPALGKLADRIAVYFVGAILLLSVLVGLYWGLLAGRSDWLGIVVAVLVVTCPCALSLATPAAITAGLGRLTRLGLLATRGHALETLVQADRFVFDKTGTLTTGELKWVDSVLLADREAADARAGEEQVLAALKDVAIALERGSEHPLAQAVRAHGSGSAVVAEALRNRPGDGICGRVDGEAWCIGNPDFVARHFGLSAPMDAGCADTRLDEYQRQGYTVIALANTEGWQLAMVFADTLRSGALRLVEGLLRRGVKLSVLSGDAQAAVDRVATQLSIRDARGDLKPDDKLAAVRQWQAAGEVVAVVGDGVNDAPVLAAAQVSVAMGGGTAIAADSADMVLLSDRLEHLAEGVAVSAATLRVIRQNLGWALAYNAAAIPLAAMGLVPPWLAAIGMSLSSLLVVANALRLTARQRHPSTPA